MTIDPITDILTPILIACVPVLAAGVTAALWRLFQWLGLKGVGQNQQNMEAQINAALSFGISTSMPILREKGWQNPDAWNAILAASTGYLRSRFPDRVKEIETAAKATTPGILAPGVPLAVRDTISARLPAAVALAAASPATPDSPKPIPLPPIAAPALVRPHSERNTMSVTLPASALAALAALDAAKAARAAPETTKPTAAPPTSAATAAARDLKETPCL